MPKVVINTVYGGFSLSAEAMELLKAKGLDEDRYWEIPRDDPRLVEVVNELGDKAAGKYTKLKVVDVPDDVKWAITERDGNEWVEEVHRTWY